MPRKKLPLTARPTMTNIGFYDRDLANVEKIREHLVAVDPSRNIKLPEVVRHALEKTARRIGATTK